MEREVLLRVDSKNNFVRLFPSFYERDKKDAQWYMENVKSPSEEIYKAKWTERGLIYTHKMNERGEFEEIEKSQEQIKAQAFDVLMKHCKVNDNWNKKISIGGDHKTYWVLNTFSGIGTEHLTEEEYEILKKAGLE